MTEQRMHDDHEPVRHRSLEDLANAKGLKPIGTVDDLAALRLDVWDSDEDLDAFLADVRASRGADVA